MPVDPHYWRSLRELYDSGSLNERKANEFLAGVTEPFNVEEMSTMSRKQFLALLAASAAFAAAGCSEYRDRGEIVPYTKKPEEVIPGVANFYASTCGDCPQGCGILIKTREGRPIKVDGNPDHPVNRGKICARGQASILDLYDPSRLRAPKRNSPGLHSAAPAWQDVDGEVVQAIEHAVHANKEIAIVASPTTSPTTARVLADFARRFPTTRIYRISLFNEAAKRRAWENCYGTPDVPSIDWSRADVVLALESDFLATDGPVVESIRGYTDRRDIMKSASFNRLYVAEGGLSLTGANADERLRLRPDAQKEFIFSLLHEIGVARSVARIDRRISTLVANASLSSFASRHSLSPPVLNRLVDDLLSHRGRGMVLAGSGLPEEVHVAVNYLNELLGAPELYGRSIPAETLSTSEELAGLVQRMSSGDVAVTIHARTNPVYHLPRSLKYAEALGRVPLSLSLVESEDETSDACAFALPVHHAFESWGDFHVRSGVLSLRQPVIAPLYDTRQMEGTLLSWIGGSGSFRETMVHEYLMARWEKDVYPASQAATDFKTFWYSALHDGVIEIKEREPARTRFNVRALETVHPAFAPEHLAVLLAESPFLGDGRSANNGWLQELPHPITKVVWDNYAAISPATGRSLGVSTNDFITVQLPSGAVTLPALLQPGQADGCVSVSPGYGRWKAGPIGTGVGFDVGPALPADSIEGSRIFSGARIARASGSHELVTTQEFHALDDEFLADLQHKRKIIREGTLREFRGNPGFLHEESEKLSSISKEVEYHGVKWAMAIDLNKCIGCNACVAGCSVENNVPVVGREQAGRGRTMHWIRIDRYYSGTDAAPSVRHQPMLCQHCDNAPCENVCPVSATNHSPDGLNQMVYNRCVGTKYCANNCPYKVRRFNFFNWRGHLAGGYYAQDIVTLANNPEVTVRSRGVMEKCTFCIQRIMEARQHAIERGEPLKGGDVRTACQEACPATAIVFGDMNDPASEVSRYRAHALGYHVLEELNVRPNVTYLAKLRNAEE